MKTGVALSLLAALALLATGCRSPAPVWAEILVGIPIITDPKHPGPGIFVEVTAPVPAAGEKRGEVRWHIHNRMGEEIFLEVTGFEEVGYYFHDRDPNSPNMAGWAGCMGRQPDNQEMLRRLAAAACACGGAWGVSHLPVEDLDLEDWVGEDTKVEIPVRGFVRRTGQQFYELAEVPVTIVAQPEASPTPAAPPAP